jgi:hypothetical protein
MADTNVDMDKLLAGLRAAGANKLAWTLEHSTNDGETHWAATLQAANEMGAPVPLPPDVEHALHEALRSGRLGTREPGSWVMDCVTGAIGHPQPRPGDGAGAPGITERTM